MSSEVHTVAILRFFGRCSLGNTHLFCDQILSCYQVFQSKNCPSNTFIRVRQPTLFFSLLSMKYFLENLETPNLFASVLHQAFKVQIPTQFQFSLLIFFRRKRKKVPRDKQKIKKLERTVLGIVIFYSILNLMVVFYRITAHTFGTVLNR